MKTIDASQLKGYATATALWRFVRDGAAALRQAHAAGKALGAVDLASVAVDEDRFVFPEANATGTPADDVRELASATFTLATGFILFEGMTQTAETPVPSLNHPELESLSALLKDALSFRPDRRPDVQTLAEEAEKALTALGRQHRPPRSRFAAAKTASRPEVDRRWPEAFLTLLLCLLLGAAPSQAQVRVDEQTSRLINVALSLRKSSNATWAAAQKQLSEDADRYTLMTEMYDREADCPLLPSRITCFGINRIINEAKAGDMVQATGKDFKDGNDLRFRYAVIEKGVRAGHIARYPLAGRSGEQVFVVVPHDPKQSFRFFASIDGEDYEAVKGPRQDGTLYLFIPEDAYLELSGDAWLMLENNGEKDAAFVLINDKRVDL